MDTDPPLVTSWIAHEPRSGTTVRTRENPAHPDRTVAQIADADAAIVRSAVATAAGASVGWALRPVSERAAAVGMALDRLDALDEGQLAALAATEIGKPVIDCRLELRAARAVGRATVELAPTTLADTGNDGPQGRLLVRQRPYGTVAAIVPWNAPFTLALAKVVPALCAGNAVVVKPSPVGAAAVTAVLAALAAALPPGLLGVVQGDVEPGTALIADPRVRRVSFTGGSRTGAAVSAICAERLVPATMELGGNDAAVVLDDADLGPEALARAVTATFRSSGQVCLAAKRWYVHESLFDEFVEGFVATAQQVLRVGDPLAEDTTMGPVITAQARDRVAGLTADAQRRGGRVLHVGSADAVVDGPGYFLRPAVVLGAADDWPVVAQEQFGPVVPIMPFRDVAEAIERANGTEFGLGSSVWTADEERAFAVAARFDAGYTFINTHNVDGLSATAPAGGVKCSGFGREFGAEGLLEYSTTHSVNMPGHARPGR